MAAYERKHEMGDLEAYEEEVKKDLKDEEEEGDLCCEKSPVSYQIRSSQFPPDKEKKVSVDPALTVKQLAKEGDHLSWSPLAPPPPGKPKFISCSLPISAAVSPPRSSSGRRKSFKKWEGPTPAEQLRPVLRSLARQHSTKPSHDFTSQQGMLLHRSKSCGEGRSSAPSVDEVDIFSRRTSMELPESGVRVLYDCTDGDAGNQKDPEEPADHPPVEENFKCGALCLFLPGFSKKKQVQASLDIEEEDQGSAVSRAVSLEKFECGSWSSAAILDADDDDDGAGRRSYFDLPLELIRSSRTECDANSSPVKSAFVFDRERKGVLKKKNTSTLAPRKSHEGSNRHVRFSTSTPTSYPTSPTSACSITPRLRKAREEFNAFLEAQST